MATINDYRIVIKSFNGENERFSHGQVVNTSGFRNVRGLEEGRYLRRPNSEEDFRLITAFMEQEIPASKRGRPPKNGGE